ncbi:T9SS type A sorting domain-containing protein [Lacinutrix sp.]|uniref:T9SS type A sorting domain-containing protein n=1 Tax=Lacinutrix sp. TaxID=1937692 RepID=UPI00261FFB19|nr:T9SS type A sorting domain-containing protein [Lacinutrix sp.]MDG1715928.1 T9SS type A sorting domain-containing protein [Lacinutrix sp.]
MKKIYFLLLTLLISSLSFSQGTETFDNFTETGSSYADGTFMGNDGSTWTYVQSRGDQSITGKSIMLGRNRTPQAEVSSGTITGGIGTISFNYQRTFSTNVNLNILVNGLVVGNVTSTDGTVQNSGTITVNQPGDVIIKLISVNNSDGQVTIDDIVWTGFTGAATPILSISSPSDNQIFPTGTTNADVSINVQNFVIGNPGAGIDGHIHWTLNGVNQPMKYDVLDEAITTVDGGTYVVVMTLVDNSHTPISPLVTDTVTFTVAFPCTLNVSTPVVTCNTITPATTDTYDVSIDYTGGGNSTYTIDTAGNGVLGGDNPSSVASGTILISGITEDTDFTVTFTGDPADSGCDFTRNISSPNCDPQLMLPILEDFAYTDGSLTSNPNWTGFSGTDGDLLVSNEKAVVQHGVPSEDASIAFTSVPGDIYYALDFSITDPGGIITGGDYEYFAVFKDDGFNFLARLDVTDATNGGDFSVGLSSSTSTATAIWATDLVYGTTYRATVRYNQTDGVSQLWIDGAASTDPSISSTGDVTTITQFALRQSDSSLNEAVLVDNLSITTTFNETLSTGEFTTNTEFRLFPNPTNTGIVNIKTTSNEAVNVTVFDILGKQVLSQTINNRLDVSNLKTGVYILQLNQDGATTTKKLVIK